MVGRQHGTDDGLRTTRLVADATRTLLQGASIPYAQLPSVMQALREIATGERRREAVPPESVLPAVIAAIRGTEKPAPKTAARSQAREPTSQRWTPVAPTNVPVKPIQKLEAALRRSPLRLDDRSAMAIARASGKPIGRDKLEWAEQVDDRLALTFGFDFGSAKFIAEFDIQGDLGHQAVTALMEMLDARS